MYNLFLSYEEFIAEKKSQVKNPGILEVPDNKSVMDLPLSHFVSLSKKKGREAIVRALLNLYRWNLKTNIKLSKWAKNMQEQLSKEMDKI